MLLSMPGQSKIAVSGKSLGGGLAMTFSKENGIQAIVTNPEVVNKNTYIAALTKEIFM